MMKVFLCLCSHSRMNEWNLGMLLIWNVFLQDLNSYLQDKVYLAGNQLTLADIFMYYGIHPLVVSRCSFLVYLWLNYYNLLSFYKTLHRLKT